MGGFQCRVIPNLRYDWRYEQGLGGLNQYEKRSTKSEYQPLGRRGVYINLGERIRTPQQSQDVPLKKTTGFLPPTTWVLAIPLIPQPLGRWAVVTSHIPWFSASVVSSVA